MQHTLAGIRNKLAAANSRGRRKAASLGLPADTILTDDLLFILQNKQGYRCAYCPRRIIWNFHLDHRVPITGGGGHTLDNIQFTCPRCNLSKHTNDHPDPILTLVGWSPDDWLDPPTHAEPGLY